jgi:hypothetical protein
MIAFVVEELSGLLVSNLVLQPDDMCRLVAYALYHACQFCALGYTPQQMLCLLQHRRSIRKVHAHDVRVDDSSYVGLIIDGHQRHPIVVF